MRITDAQVHIWDTERTEPGIALEREPGFADLTREPFLVEQLKADMAVAQVDRVVLIPDSRRGEAILNNEYSLAVAADDPGRLAVIALLDREPPSSKDYMAEIAGIPQVKGFRFGLTQGWDVRDWVWSEAIRLGMPVAILPNRGSFEMLPPILDNCPDLSVLICHAALPALGPDPFAEFDKLLGLEKYRNVVVQCSSMARFSSEPYPFSDVLPYIRRLFDTFGPERLAWGSNYTTHSDRVSYGENVDLIREASDWLSVSDREWILDRTLSRVLDWH